MMFTNAEYIRPGQNNSGGEMGEIAGPGVTQKLVLFKAGTEIQYIQISFEYSNIH